MTLSNPPHISQVHEMCHCICVLKARSIVQRRRGHVSWRASKRGLRMPKVMVEEPRILPATPQLHAALALCEESALPRGRPAEDHFQAELSQQAPRAESRAESPKSRARREERSGEPSAASARCVAAPRSAGGLALVREHPLAPAAKRIRSRRHRQVLEPIKSRLEV